MPSYVEPFQVNKVEFGALSPILCNFKWEPQYNRPARSRHHQGQGQGEPSHPGSGDTPLSDPIHKGGGGGNKGEAKLSAEALDAEHAYSSIVVAADVTFRSGITIYLDTNVTLMGLKVKVGLFSLSLSPSPSLPVRAFI